MVPLITRCRRALRFHLAPFRNRAEKGDSSYRLNFDQGKKNEIQHHS
jgi:hypothetical protein